MTWILCTIFFASGASALVFETLWFHQTGLALGNSVWASSLVLAGFMAGLAIGNGLAARLGDRMGNPVRAYALFEIAIAVSGVALVLGLPLFSPWLAGWMGDWLDRPWLLGSVRLCLAFALLLIPSTAMGVTLPLLVKALTRAGDVSEQGRFGRVLGRLYGWNTLGAVAGVLGTEAFLVATLGIHGTALAAGALNAAAAAIALFLAPRFDTREVDTREVTGCEGAGPEVNRTLDPVVLRWWLAAFLSGFALLSLEVVWFRILALYVLGNAVSLAVMLATVLAGIGLGGFAAAAWLRRDADAHRYAEAVAAMAGAAAIVGYVLLPWLVDDLGHALIGAPTAIFQLGAPLMLPTAFLSGIFFTLAGAALRGQLASETETAGSLTFANTLGSALGSLAGGFALLPLFGMEAAIFAVALVYAGVAALAWKGGLAHALRPAIAGAVALALGLVLFPFGTMRDHHVRRAADRWAVGGEADVVLMHESPISTVIYLDRRELGAHHSYRLVTNGFSMSGDDNRNRRYMKLYVYWPVAVHPDPKDALLISYGVGSTAKALTDTAALERIDVVDISKAILESNHVVYSDPAEHPLNDPRVTVHVEDGRYFLQTTDRRFDLITAEPPPPRETGVVNLYTREYFDLIRERLAEGGVATYWLPLHALNENSAKAILAAFCGAFDDCSLWNGNGYDLMMVGTRGAAGPVTEEHFQAQWRDPVVGPELRELGFDRPEQLGALFIGGADYLKNLTRDTPPLVDDWPKRITAPGEFPTRLPVEYLAWRDVDAARERFEQSDLIERLWPGALRESSLPAFDVQRLINLAGYAPDTPLDQAIDDLHRTLDEPGLVAPVLWALDSDFDIQRIMGQLGPVDRIRPGAQFHIGVGHLAGRRWEAAAAAFARAEAHPSWGRDAFRLRAYALCRADRCDDAEVMVGERYTSAGSPEDLPPFWAWMRETYGLDPARSARVAGTP